MGATLTPDRGVIRLVHAAGTSNVRGMEDIIDCFHRDSSGHWICTRPCEIELPGGRVQMAVGTRFSTGERFMDVDIALLLDEERERNSRAN